MSTKADKIWPLEQVGLKYALKENNATLFCSWAYIQRCSSNMKNRAVGCDRVYALYST